MQSLINSIINKLLIGIYLRFQPGISIVHTNKCLLIHFHIMIINSWYYYVSFLLKDNLQSVQKLIGTISKCKRLQLLKSHE